jgi:class 3 adenylate cyclase
MTTSPIQALDALSVYMPIDRRYALARGERLPDRVTGTALYADLSGFTPLTEALAQALGMQRGAEEVARRLNLPIIALVDTNCDPDLVTYPIAGNDDAIRAVKLITNVIAETVIEVQTELGKEIPLPPQTAAVEPVPVVEAVPAVVAEPANPTV